MKKMLSKKTITIFGIGIGIEVLALLFATLGFTYSWFSASVTQNEVKDQVVTTGTLSLRYVDGPEIKMENIRPGSTITKTVYVANTGTLDVSYNLVWQSILNEIKNDEMLIESTCTRMDSTTETESGACTGIDSKPIYSNRIKSNINIEPNMVHKYDITITFKETNDNQNYNQGKNFNGVIGIEETSKFDKDSWDTVIANVKSGNTSMYNVGDTKEITLKTLGTFLVRLTNKSTPSECSTEEFSQSACGFVIEFDDFVSKRAINTNTNKGGWPASTMYSYVNNDIYNEMPDNVKTNIIDTTVVSGHGKNDTDNFVSTDKYICYRLKKYLILAHTIQHKI